MGKASTRKRPPKPPLKKAAGQDSPPLRLEYRTAAELADNPANWRTHPDPQLAALRDVIADVGWAGACLLNERTGRLIDGHARKKIAKAGERIPVLVGNWTEEQERTILATLDPLAAMAGANAEALDKLLREVQTGSEALGQMLAKLAEDAGVTPPNFQPVGIDEQGRLDEKAKVKCPECGHEFAP